MKLPTALEVRALLSTLNQKELTFAFHAFVRPLPENRNVELTALDTLSLYLYEWLKHLNVFERSQARDIVTKLRQSPEALLTKVVSNTTTTMTVASRFVTWEGRDCWFDSIYGTDIQQLDAAPVTLIICDISALWLQKTAWLAKLYGGTDARHHNTADTISDEADRKGFLDTKTDFE